MDSFPVPRQTHAHSSDSKSATPLLHKSSRPGLTVTPRGRGLVPRSRSPLHQSHTPSSDPDLSDPTGTIAATGPLPPLPLPLPLPPPPPSSSSSSSSSSLVGPALGRPALSRVSSRFTHLRSRSPSIAAVSATHAARVKYTYAAFFLALSLVTFTAQTELSIYIQHDLGWHKAYFMMYLTHGSWVFMWPVLLLGLRWHRRDVPWPVFWRRHVQMIRGTALMVQTRRLDVSKAAAVSAKDARGGPWLYIARTAPMIAMALTVAGLSWYVAVDMTSAADLTAIYNCSAFFAYAFSVPILRERPRTEKSAAVLVAIVGVLVVAYGDADPSDDKTPGGGRRFVGNVIVGTGSVLIGLYEVLYKRYACPPDGASPFRSAVFAATFGSCLGTFTLFVLWIPIPLLHLTGIEPFALPTDRAAVLTMVAVFTNVVFNASFLALISLTSPVLTGVASLLTIFLVAVADWFVKRKALSWAAILGGGMIIIAFLVLSWSSYKEMAEGEGEAKLADPTGVDLVGSGDESDDDDSDTGRSSLLHAS